MAAAACLQANMSGLSMDQTWTMPMHTFKSVLLGDWQLVRTLFSLGSRELTRRTAKNVLPAARPCSMAAVSNQGMGYRELRAHVLVLRRTRPLSAQGTRKPGSWRGLSSRGASGQPLKSSGVGGDCAWL